MTMNEKPLWTETHISNALGHGQSVLKPKAVALCLRIVSEYEATIDSLHQQIADSVPRSEVNAMIDNNRVSDAVTIDSLSHELARLKQQLAEAQAWEAVPSSLEYDLITYAILNGKIPVEYHIMRRRTQGGE